MKNLGLIITFQLLLFTACAQEKTPEADNGILIFQSGFEPDSKVISKGSEADIIGTDRSFPDHNDWVNDLDNHPDIGNFSLQYQGGDSTMRFAKIIPEPGNPSNHVLHFWLNEPNVEASKGRIQGNLYGNKEGNASTGRFYMTIQPDGGKKEVIYDLTKITHNSTDPNPDGVTDFNPIKLYTSKGLIDYMRGQGKSLQIYWDDFRLWKDKKP